MAEIADDVDVVAKRLERLQDLETGSRHLAPPASIYRAVRNIDAAEARLRFAAVRAPLAGTIDSRSGSPSVTPAPRRNVRRERCFSK